MAQGVDVLTLLRPQGGWIIYGDDFESIQWVFGKPITKEEFEAGFAQYDAWKAQKDAEAAAKRQALLEKLGITEEEAKLLLA
jgi:hypothetical protein